MTPPPSTFSRRQLATIQGVIVGATALSVLGCGYILAHLFRRSRRAPPTLTQTMVAILSLLDVTFALPKTLGMPRSRTACNVQAFWLAWVSVMSVVWNACLAHSIHRKVVYRESEARLQRYLGVYLAITAGPAFVAAVVEVALDMYGDAIFYCWLRDRRWHLPCLYLWALLAIVYIAAVLVITQRHIRRRARIQGNREALESSAVITLQLRLYIVLFAITWLPGVIFRVFGEFLGTANFTMALIMQGMTCALGFNTSIVYGGLLSHPLSLCRPRDPNAYQAMTLPTTHTTSSAIGPTTTTADSVRAGGATEGNRYPLQMFVTTFNLGEGQLSADELAKWIPRGYDLYVIGVQECLHLPELRQQICRHIEGHEHLLSTASSRARFMRYAQYCREIGSTNTSLGYHGFIAVTIYVRLRDVTSGAFFMAPTAQQEVNCGKSLLFGQRASNKGAVGFGFRYFDTSFAFVTCHLSSDLKGKSHVGKRNRDASAVVQSLHLNIDDTGFEFPLMHHHTFILGDLNYRLRQQSASPNQILDLVAAARRDAPEDPSAEFRRLLLSSAARRGRMSRIRAWLPSPFSHIEDDPDVMTKGFNHQTTSVTEPEPDEAESSIDDERQRETSWADVMTHDELSSLMGQSQVFYGFREAPIAFDPTFRRVRGRALPSRDVAMSVDELAKHYTTSIDGRGERVPSYTDRILHHSLPDLQGNLQCVLYSSAEDVMCSDHKPVCAVFQTVVNRDVRPLISRCELETRPRMQDLAGVVECTLRMECSAVRWLDKGLCTADHELLSGLRVTIVFPLPSEDTFSEQRRLHELAEMTMMRGGVFTDSSPGPSGAHSMSNTMTVSLLDFTRLGIVHSTLLRPMRRMHVALKVHTEGSSPKCHGQGVLGLSKQLVVDAPGETVAFEMGLSVGGRRTGTLEGTFALDMTRPS